MARGGDGLLEIGRIGRPCGLRGEVAVTLVSNRPERLAPASQLETERGSLRVARARRHGSRHIVAFEGVYTRDQAESLKGLVLRAPPLWDPEEMWAHDLIGAQLVDQFGNRRGAVERVVANPASDLLELADGALVPVCFVIAVAPGVRIDVDAPDGLFEVD